MRTLAEKVLSALCSLMQQGRYLLIEQLSIDKMHSLWTSFISFTCTACAFVCICQVAQGSESVLVLDAYGLLAEVRCYHNSSTLTYLLPQWFSAASV
jgi:hypothetical protein